MIESIISKASQFRNHLFGLFKFRAYATMVADRTIVHAPNHVPGQKPITVGHEYRNMSGL
jgi:hypothetical protein